MITTLAICTALLAETVEITIIDAGNANCIVAQIPYKDGRVQAVFDAGYEVGLKKPDVDKIWARFQEVMGDGEEDIELLVISHVDWDHTMLLDKILAKYDVDVAFYPDRLDALVPSQWKGTATKVGFHKLIEEKVRLPLPIGTDGAVHGKRLAIGDATLRIMTGYNVPPPSFSIPATTSNKSAYNNAASIVVRLAYFGASAIFMGDSYGGKDGQATKQPKWGEGDILDSRPEEVIKSDVLVAGHHGANNASFTNFIEAVQPSFVVFTSGEGHNHPYKTAFNRLFKKRASDGVKLAVSKFFRTDRNDPRESATTEWQGGHGSSIGTDLFDDEVLIELERGKPVRVKYVNP